MYTCIVLLTIGIVIPSGFIFLAYNTYLEVKKFIIAKRMHKKINPRTNWSFMDTYLFYDSIDYHGTRYCESIMDLHEEYITILHTVNENESIYKQ